MLPTGLTITGLLASAAEVVGQFDGLITLVVGLSLGFFVVGWIMKKAASVSEPGGFYRESKEERREGRAADRAIRRMERSGYEWDYDGNGVGYWRKK